MKWISSLIIISLIIILFTSGCAQKCGDDICSPKEERRGTCPSDCTTTPGNNQLTPGDYRLTLNYDSLIREYEIHVPQGYDNQVSTPLVLNFHGGAGNIDNAKKGTQMSPVSDKEGFIVVYPQASGEKTVRGITRGSWNAIRCCGTGKENNVDDVGFIRELVKEVSKKVNIDQKRVYAIGHSNGAAFTERLGCEASDIFAAVAMNAGRDSLNSCTGKIPSLFMQGTADPEVTHLAGTCGGRVDPGWKCRSFDEYLDVVATRNGCDDTKEVILSIGDATCSSYNSCDEEVNFCVIENHGHHIPGGEANLPEKLIGPLNNDLDGAQFVWDFFSDKIL